ncbi:MAG: MraY family glycosyltransferase [Pseudomonadota bacterium]
MSNLVLISLTLLALVVCVFVCQLAERAGTWLRVIDYPDVTGGRKRHMRPTPLMGGIAVLSAMAATAPLAVWLSGPVNTQAEAMVAIAALVGLFAFTGFIDDREELSPKIRLVIMLLGAGFVVHNQPALTVQFLHFDFLRNAYILGGWGIVFTLLALVGLANAVNMADGKNGLVIGMCLVWNTVLLLFGAPIVIPILVLSLAAVSAAFVYNMRGRLFLGDTGSFGLACFYGLIAIYSYTQNFVRLPADVIALMFMVPVLDCLRLMISRVLRGSSPFSAGRDHLHHHIAASVGWTSGLFLYLGLIAVPLALRLVFPEFAGAAVAIQASGYCFVLSICAYGAYSNMRDMAA